VTRVLLDTNALIYCLISPDRFGKKATEFFDQAEEVFYSSISIFEITLKQSLGKIQLPDFSSGTLPLSVYWSLPTITQTPLEFMS